MAAISKLNFFLTCYAKFRSGTEDVLSLVGIVFISKTLFDVVMMGAKSLILGLLQEFDVVLKGWKKGSWTSYYSILDAETAKSSIKSINACV